MKASLLTYLVCPFCHAPLTLQAGAQHEAVIESSIVETGTLQCSGCGRTFPVEHGIPNMLSPDLPGIEPKLREARGWAQLSQQQGWYTAEERIDLALPDVVGQLGWDPVGASGWVATHYSFGHLLDCYVRPGMRVLEIGAAKTWAGRYFNARGCTYTACDIMADPHIGLGRSRFFIERFGHYEAVAADAENLPFASGYFDLTFAIAALHHALDLSRMMREMARVTRRSGIVAGLNEGVRAFNANPNAEIQATEKTFGINEHVYTLGDYLWAFTRHKLLVTEVDRSIGFAKLAPPLQARVNRLLRIPLLGKWGAAFYVLGFVHTYDGVSLYARKL